MSGMMILTDSLAMSLLNQKKVTDALPGLKQIATKVDNKKSGCRKCGKKVDVAKNVQKIKDYIVNLTKEKQTELKKILGASTIIIFHYVGDGRRKRLTI